MESKQFRDTRTGEIVTQFPISEINHFVEVGKSDQPESMEALQLQLVNAKDKKDVPEINRIIAEMLRPEAREVIALTNKSITTKDGYAVILQMLPNLKPYTSQFFKALQLEGYPAETLDSLKEMAGI